MSSGDAARPILTLVSTIVSGNTATAANGRSDIADRRRGDGERQLQRHRRRRRVHPVRHQRQQPAFGAALNLLPLANNGGPTPTIALGAGSPAVDAGANPAGLTTDQRGPGFPRVRRRRPPDIGAFEGILDAPAATGGPFANVTAAGGTTYTFTVTYTGDTADQRRDARQQRRPRHRAERVQPARPRSSA